jgi:hypothetical protein
MLKIFVIAKDAPEDQDLSRNLDSASGLLFVESVIVNLSSL